MDAAIAGSANTYRFDETSSPKHEAYLLPIVSKALRESGVRRIFEIGCGNGRMTAALASQGYDIRAIEPSTDGVRIAKLAGLRVEAGSAYDDLEAKYGTFDSVVSLEVVEHLYDPALFASRAFDLLQPGGTFVLSTPFHNYWKNLAIALAGKWDDHAMPLLLHGHIKFWSEATLRKLLLGAGFEQIRFYRAGRISILAKAFVAVAQRPL